MAGVCVSLPGMFPAVDGQLPGSWPHEDEEDPDADSCEGETHKSAHVRLSHTLHIEIPCILQWHPFA